MDRREAALVRRILQGEVQVATVETLESPVRIRIAGRDQRGAPVNRELFASTPTQQRERIIKALMEAGLSGELTPEKEGSLRRFLEIMFRGPARTRTKIEALLEAFKTEQDFENSRKSSGSSSSEGVPLAKFQAGASATEGMEALQHAERIIKRQAPTLPNNTMESRPSTNVHSPEPDGTLRGHGFSSEAAVNFWSRFFRSDGGSYLQSLREAGGLTVESVAERCGSAPGLTADILRQLELGQYLPSPEQTKVLSSILNVTEDTLLQAFYGPPIQLYFEASQGMSGQELDDFRARFEHELRTRGFYSPTQRKA